jgi:hypothetical protein
MNTAARLNSRPGRTQVASDPPSALATPVLWFTALCYLATGLGFSYVHRHAGTFGFEALLWLGWTWLGYGCRLWWQYRPPRAGRSQKQWRWLASLGLFLGVMPGFLMFSPPRWAALMLMIGIGARAVMLHNRRDLNTTVVACLAVSFLVATHAGANWTLWTYLGPAWFFATLALAWDHNRAYGVRGRPLVALATGFVAVCWLLAALMQAALPLPGPLGGELSPEPALTQSTAPPSGTGSAGPAPSTQAGSDRGPPTPDGVWTQRRQLLQDPHIPQWQATVLGGLIDLGEGIDGALAQASAALTSTIGVLPWWWLALGLAVLCWLWRHRWRLASLGAMGVARLCAWPWPARSVSAAAWALDLGLRDRGHPWLPELPRLTRWQAVPEVPEIVSHWLGQAASAHSLARFGPTPATPELAHAVIDRVWASLQVLKAHPRWSPDRFRRRTRATTKAFVPRDGPLR